MKIKFVEHLKERVVRRVPERFSVLRHVITKEGMAPTYEVMREYNEYRVRCELGATVTLSPSSPSPIVEVRRRAAVMVCREMYREVVEELMRMQERMWELGYNDEDLANRLGELINELEGRNL